MPSEARKKRALVAFLFQRVCAVFGAARLPERKDNEKKKQNKTYGGNYSGSYDNIGFIRLCRR